MKVLGVAYGILTWSSTAQHTSRFRGSIVSSSQCSGPARWLVQLFYEAWLTIAVYKTRLQDASYSDNASIAYTLLLLHAGSLGLERHATDTTAGGRRARCDALASSGSCCARQSKKGAPFHVPKDNMADFQQALRLIRYSKFALVARSGQVSRARQGV